MAISGVPACRSDPHKHVRISTKAIEEPACSLTDLVIQQVAAARQQIDTARRQKARIKLLEHLLLQQTAAMKAQALLRRLHPGGPQVPLVGAVFPVMVEGAERERLMDRLNEFRRYSSIIFDGEKADHWIIEKWLMHMEKLFRDTFVEERVRVWLATHFWTARPIFDGWCQEEDGVGSARDVPGGPDCGRVREKSFSRLLHCVPFVVRDDEDKACIFERGLRPSIFRFVQSSNLQTYREVVNRALIVESGAADVQERREGIDKGKGKRPRLRVRVRFRRPLKHPRSQQPGRGSAVQ
uniref:Uncharacterized protein n=1 Tax=Ananas comosus var. bracteatus TaxID=296719 RepID=A0A6V7QLE9_ANACO|nr:unnamed protein product [Ananas comosus var. bracteatus]